MDVGLLLLMMMRLLWLLLLLLLLLGKVVMLLLLVLRVVVVLGHSLPAGRMLQLLLPITLSHFSDPKCPSFLSNVALGSASLHGCPCSSL